jgi:hypothetical protein
MKTPDLILRCYAVKRSGHWEAFCIDLCLAAQADTFADARGYIETQIKSYVEEALTVDRQYAAYLLSRKAPIAQRVEYSLIRFFQSFHVLKNDIYQVYKTILPVHAGTPHHA